MSTRTTLTRRGFLAGPASLATAGAAESGPPDVGVYCEPTLAPAIRAAGRVFQARHDAPVAVLTAPGALILAQVKQNSAEDLLVLPTSAMDGAAEQHFIDPASRSDAWRNALVLAMRADAPPVPSAGLPALLSAGRVAATDPTVAAAFDGVGLLGRLGVAGLLGDRIAGAPNTEDVAYMVRTGAARFGVMFMTDLRADRTLRVAATLDPAIATPIVFSVALNVKPPHRNARAFLDFLGSPDAAAILRDHGLEIA